MNKQSFIRRGDGLADFLTLKSNFHTLKASVSLFFAVTFYSVN